MAEPGLIPAERIERCIVVIRGEKVTLDRDLGQLYGVETRTLLQAVKRNADRFPPDFAFQLTSEEFDNLRSQIVISSWGGRRYPPYAFTEHGIAMLSSVLRSPRAVQVNIEIMRAFIRLRRMLASNAELARRLDQLEKRYDAQFKIVFDAIRALMAAPPAPSHEPPEEPQRSIGFKAEERRLRYRRSRRGVRGAAQVSGCSWTGSAGAIGGITRTRNCHRRDSRG